MVNLFKKVFITGGAGYVGSLLVPNLLNKGYEVVVFDKYIYSYKFLEHKNLTQIEGDIRNKDLLLDSSKDCDAFINLACISNDPSFDLNPDLGKSINFDAFINIVDVCKENDIKRLIMASSTSQYGIKPLDFEVTEDCEAEPITDYAKYKIECEKYLLDRNDINFEYTFVRPATLCGYAPRLRLDLSINILTLNALVNKKIKVFGGEQMRPALNIRDMVRFYGLILESPKEKIHKEAFNVSFENKTIMQLAKEVQEVLGDDSIEIEVTPSNDNRSYHVNTDKMKNVLGFECKYDFKEAILSLKDMYERGLIVDPLNNSMYHNVKRMKEINLE
jgi:nucleoside-diphosphate-sugar epimerase